MLWTLIIIFKWKMFFSLKDVSASEEVIIRYDNGNVKSAFH